MRNPEEYKQQLKEIYLGHYLALEKAEEYYQKNPAQFYTLTSRFINENLGPTK